MGWGTYDPRRLPSAESSSSKESSSVSACRAISTRGSPSQVLNSEQTIVPLTSSLAAPPVQDLMQQGHCVALHVSRLLASLRSDGRLFPQPCQESAVHSTIRVAELLINRQGSWNAGSGKTVRTRGSLPRELNNVRPARHALICEETPADPQGFAGSPIQLPARCCCRDGYSICTYRDRRPGFLSKIMTRTESLALQGLSDELTAAGKTACWGTWMNELHFSTDVALFPRNFIPRVHRSS